MSEHPSTSRHSIILVVDDEEGVRMPVAEFLKDDGFCVIEAANADSACQLMAVNRVDLVFSDINMPGKMQGNSLADWVAYHRPGVPVLLTSGNRNVHISGSCRRFISKPYRIADVGQEIKRLLSE